MAEPWDPKQRRPSGETPKELPETTPPQYPGADYSFFLQATFEIQKAIGGLTQAVSGLQTEVNEQRKTLRWIRWIIAFTAGGIVVGGAIISFIIERGYDKLISAIKDLSS